MQTGGLAEHDIKFLREAIALAREHSLAKAGGPFGALIARDGVVLGRGWNQVTSTNDPTAHAEIVAIRNACLEARAFHLRGAVLYTTCEPCPMCLMAARWARLGRVIYAADRHDAAAVGFDDARFYGELTGAPSENELGRAQLLRDEAVAVMREWAALPGKVGY
jgi:guanine deaminase